MGTLFPKTSSRQWGGWVRGLTFAEHLFSADSSTLFPPVVSCLLGKDVGRSHPKDATL